MLAFRCNDAALRCVALLIILFIVAALAGSNRCQASEEPGRVERGPYCGLYSVHGALSALGIEADFESLLMPEYIGSKHGSTALELKRAAQDMGAEAEIVAGLGGESLRHAMHPMILHVASDGQLYEYDHWLLFLGVQDGKARIVDVPDRLALVPMAKVLSRWDGAALVVSDHPVNTAAMAGSQNLALLKMCVLFAAILILARLLLRSRAVIANTRGHLATAAGSLREAGFLAVVVIGVTVADHALGPDGFLRNRAAASYVAAAHLDSFFPKLAAHEVFALTQREDAVIIDARHAGEYERRHIPGAINVPIDARPDERRQILANVPKSAPLLIYCLGPRCRFDDKTGILLAREGFENISLYPGGWREWRESEYHQKYRPREGRRVAR